MVQLPILDNQTRIASVLIPRVQGMEKLTSGCKNLDRLLNGGFPFHQVSFVYGEASTGKTILSIQSAVEAALRDCKVFYLDTDGSFSPHRLELLPISTEAAERIVIFRPDEFREQIGITETLENLLTKSPTLLVVDSVTGLYRASLRRPHDAFTYNRELNRQLAYLTDLSRRFMLGIILTGEVHSQPGPVEWTVEPVATRTLEHWSRLILRLTHTPRRDVRECVLEKIEGRRVSGQRSLFRITENGVEDV